MKQFCLVVKSFSLRLWTWTFSWVKLIWNHLFLYFVFLYHLSSCNLFIRIQMYNKDTMYNFLTFVSIEIKCSKTVIPQPKWNIRIPIEYWKQERKHWDGRRGQKRLAYSQSKIHQKKKWITKIYRSGIKDAKWLKDTN